MIVNKKNIKFAFTDLLLIAVSLFFTVGIVCWFRACPPRSDGSYMNCHWAEQIITAIAALSLAVSFCHLWIPDEKIKTGMDVVLVGILIVCAIIPDSVIPLCMMKTMSCHSTMKPWTIAFCIVLTVLSVLDSVFYLKRKKQ